MKFLVSLSLLVLVFAQAGQADFKKDREQILGMAGCYEVQFQFAETFPRTQGYKIKEPYFAKALEWVEVEVDQPGKIELQHLLIVGPQAVIKHWRQEWTYEDTRRFAFKGDARWELEEYSAATVFGQWEQNVSQVDDSPRYECQAAFVHQESQSFWECRSWNPLPRREFSKRNDYNVLDRRNRHQLTSYGWIHEQDNSKVIAQNGQQQSVLTEEKGKNIYTKVADTKCIDAQTWWTPRKTVWSAIREAWDQVHSDYSVLDFKKMSRPLHQELGQMSEKAMLQQWSSNQVTAEAVSIIQSHLK